MIGRSAMPHAYTICKGGGLHKMGLSTYMHLTGQTQGFLGKQE